MAFRLLPNPRRHGFGIPQRRSSSASGGVGLLSALRCLCAAIQCRLCSAITQPRTKFCGLGVGFPSIGAFSHRIDLDVDGQIEELRWKIRPCRGRLKEMLSRFSFFRQVMGGRGGESPFMPPGFTVWVQWMQCRFSTSAIGLRIGGGPLTVDQWMAMTRSPFPARRQSARCLLLMERCPPCKVIRAGWVSTLGRVIRAIRTAWVPNIVWVQTWFPLLGWLSPGVGGLVFWYGFHIWDPGGKYGQLGLLALQRRYSLVWLINKETVFTLTLYFGVEGVFCSLLVFSFPYRLVEIVLYCFNEFQLNYCTVSTTIECIGEQHCQFFWDEDSLHQLVVVFLFYFQEVREHYVIYQPIRQHMVDVALDFLINHCWLILAPAIVQDAPHDDCNRGYS